MVTRSRPLSAALLLAWALAAGGCGLIHRWWGEEPPEPAMVQQSEAGSCPGIGLVFTGDEESSVFTLNCWKKKSGELWTQIEGTRKNELSEAELAALVRQGVLPLEGDREEGLRQLIALKRLLGIPGTLTRQELDGWLGWLTENRSNLRRIRAKFYASGEREFISYDDIQLAGATISDFLHRARWRMSSEEFGDEIVPLLGRNFLYLRQAAVPMARVMINTAAAICPTITQKSTWAAAELGDCLQKLIAHFEVGAPWFEFILNPESDNYSAEKVTQALDALKPRMEEWFTQPSLGTANTLLWVELGRSLGLDLDEDSLDSIKWVHQFNSLSTTTSIHPTAVLPLYDIVRESQKKILEGLPFYSHCDFRDPVAWKTCTPDISADALKKSPLLDYALQIRNLNYGGDAVPLNRSVFQRIMFFDAAAKRIIQALASPDGTIEVGKLSNNPELLKLFDVGFQFQENTEFVDKIQSRLKGNVPASGNEPSFLRKYDHEGIMKLVTLMGDTLFHRKKDDIFASEKELPLSIFVPRNKFVLDRPSLAAVLSTIDLLPDFRHAYIENDAERLGLPIVVANTFTGGLIVSRKAVMKALPDILKNIYPRIYESCTKIGYAHSCGIVYDELIPGNDDQDLLHLSDLDIITITSIFAESVMDSCDENFDQKLSSHLFDGNDELDCGFEKLKDSAERLMDAGIIQNDPGIRRALRFVNAFFLTRPLGKIALARGSKKNLPLHYVPGLFNRQEASLGSMMSLAAEIINEQKYDDLKESDKQLRQQWEAAARSTAQRK